MNEDDLDTLLTFENNKPKIKSIVKRDNMADDLGSVKHMFADF
jgi:hypothetical protein